MATAVVPVASRPRRRRTLPQPPLAAHRAYNTGVILVYLISLGLGIGVLGLQLATGHDSDADGDHSHDGDHDGLFFLSTRFWVFALLAFGMVGTALTLLHLTAGLVTLAIAAPTGLAAGLGASATMKALRSGQVGATGSLTDAVGQVGRVLLPMKPGQRGKVRLLLKGHSVDVIATSRSEEIPAGSRALVADVVDGVALVTKAPEELGP
jgi:hypothetical protein